MMTTTILETHCDVIAMCSIEPRSTAGLRLSVVEDAETILAVREPWNQLAGEHPFLRWEWIASWWQAYGDSRRAVVLTVRDQDGRWVGLLPLQIEQRPFWGRVLTNLANARACSDHMRPIIANGYESAVLRLMANWINQQAAQGQFDLIELDGVDVADPIVEQLLSELVRAGMTRHDTEIEGSWIAELPTDWNAFALKTKKCFRRKMQKACRNQALPGVEIETISSAAAMRENWPTLVRLHEARRGEKNQLGCFQEAGFAAFLLQAASRMADCGDAVLLLAKLDGLPFGAVLLLLNQGSAYMYQSGYDPAQRHLEPGHLMAACAVQFALRRQLTEFDFLRGDEAYKARWNTVRQAMTRIRVVPRRWPARLRMWLWTKQQTIKSRLRRPTIDPGRLESEANEVPESMPGNPLSGD